MKRTRARWQEKKVEGFCVRVKRCRRLKLEQREIKIEE